MISISTKQRQLVTSAEACPVGYARRSGLAFELREQPLDILARVRALRRLGAALGKRTKELVEPCQSP